MLHLLFLLYLPDTLRHVCKYFFFGARFRSLLSNLEIRRADVLGFDTDYLAKSDKRQHFLTSSLTVCSSDKEQLVEEEDDELKEVLDLRKIAVQLLQQEQQNRYAAPIRLWTAHQTLVCRLDVEPLCAARLYVCLPVLLLCSSCAATMGRPRNWSLLTFLDRLRL